MLRVTLIRMHIFNRDRDIKSHPQMCSVYMETRDGGNCVAKVTCDDGISLF